ncbi:YitT family protein [Mycoplasma crocodyli]|uniref:Putative membrane protein n=1 Tax=Mycoplasma crocodyli (strain ATCC 51981 / MP145) TaxID=512564 RepID=D5E568_MYCCM|nr:YitT family protein [Mycoplasma crocodyli]ADE19843.1 putative membrane protein [Mycoplasma crocodyli MP145]
MNKNLENNTEKNNEIFEEKNEQNNIKPSLTNDLKIASRNKYIRTKVNANMLYFSHLYGSKNNFIKQLLLVSLLAVLFTVPAVFLLQNSGLYDIGIGAFGQAFGRLSRYLIIKGGGSQELAYSVYNSFFWVSYFVLNVPLIWLAYKHLSKRFAILSAIFIIEQSIVGVLMGFIPNIERVSFFTDLAKDSPAVFEKFGISSVMWNYPDDASKHLSVFLYGISWGLVNASITSLLLILEASTGGWDILGSYEAKRTRKDLGKIFFILNFGSLIFANFVGTYIPSSLALQQSSFLELQNKAWNVDLLFNPNFLSGIVMIMLYTFVLNLIFPKYTMVQVQIFTSDAETLLSNISEKTFGKYSFSIVKVIGSYSKQEQKMLITNCMYLDAADLHSVVRSFDKNSFFSVIDIKKADGNIYIKDDV